MTELELTSNTVVDFDGKTIVGDYGTFCDLLGGLKNVVIRNLHLENFKYGFLGGKGGASDITLENVTLRNAKGQKGNLIYGNGVVDFVTMRNCKAWVARPCITGANAKGWRVFDCWSFDCFDSAFYMRGVDHVVQRFHVYRAGKDAVKAVDDPSKCQYTARCKFLDGYIDGYSYSETDSGGAINMSCEDGVARGNIVRLHPKTAAMPETKGLRCVNTQRPGCVIEDNQFILPDNYRYNDILIQDDANEENTFVDNNKVRRYPII